MTVFVGDSGRFAHSALKTIDITQPFLEDNVDVGRVPSHFTSSLPLTNTGAGVSFTVEQSHLPTFSDNSFGCKYSGVIYLSGKNNTAGAVTINLQAKKNGVNQGTAATVSVSANSWWTAALFRYYDTLLGDALSVELWATAAGMTVDYTGFSVYPTRITSSVTGSYPHHRLLRDLNIFTKISNHSLLPATGGTPYAFVSNAMQVTLLNRYDSTDTLDTTSNSATANIATNGRFQFPAVALTSDYGLGRMGSGDAIINVTSSAGYSTLYRYFYYQVYYSKITYREMLR